VLTFHPPALRKNARTTLPQRKQAGRTNAPIYGIATDSSRPWPTGWASFSDVGALSPSSIIYRTHELAGLTTLQPGRPNNEPDADESRQALLNGFYLEPEADVIECVDRIHARNTVAEAGKSLGCAPQPDLSG
jgi:hypothetical protein